MKKLGINQKNYMRHEYAKMWSKMRRKTYDYNQYDRFLFSLIKKKLISKKQKNLEVCCGDGYPFASKLITLKHNYFGIDISNILIEKAQKEYGKEYFKVGDAKKLNFKKNFFKLVFCFHSFWYISDTKKAIKEMIKTLKPKGHLIFDVLNSLNEQVIKNHNNIIFESNGLGKVFRYIKNIIKLITFIGYPKWNDVIHQKPNSVVEMIDILTKKNNIKVVQLFGQKNDKSKVYKLNTRKILDFKIYKKIIFLCQKI